MQHNFTYELCSNSCRGTHTSFISLLLLVTRSSDVIRSGNIKGLSWLSLKLSNISKKIPQLKYHFQHSKLKWWKHCMACSRHIQYNKEELFTFFPIWMLFIFITKQILFIDFYIMTANSAYLHLTVFILWNVFLMLLWIHHLQLFHFMTLRMNSNFGLLLSYFRVAVCLIILSTMYFRG